MRALRSLVAVLVLWAAIELLHVSPRALGDHLLHLHLH